MKITFPGVLAYFTWVQMAWAQPPAVTDEVYMKAALVVKTFEYFAAACNQRRGFTAAEAAGIDAWQRNNGVEPIRARLSELEQFPAQKLQLDQAVATMAKLAAARGAKDCAAALSLTRAPHAQFAKVAPELLAGASAAPAAPAPPPAKPAAAPARAASKTTASGSHAEVLAQIDSFGFNTRMSMGVGGMLTTDTYPIVLFRNGDVLKRVQALTYPGGPAVHKRDKPEDWTRWQRSGGALQIATAKGWEKLPFQTTYAKLPDGLRINGLYRRLGGTGNVAIGGGDSVAAWTDYRFSADGQVERGGGAGAHAQSSGGSVVSQSVAANRRGRYRIEGLLLHIDYDDGSSEQRILIADPNGPLRAIWLDGAGYVLRGERAGAQK